MPILLSDFSLIFVMGPVKPFLPSPDTEEVGDSLGALVLKDVIA